MHAANIFQVLWKKGEGDDSPQMPEVVQWLHCVTIRLALKI